MVEIPVDGCGSVASIFWLCCRELHRSEQRRIKADFLHRIRIAKKEATETKLWLRLLGETTTDETLKTILRPLFKESDELTRILATILKNADK